MAKPYRYRWCRRATSETHSARRARSFVVPLLCCTLIVTCAGPIPAHFLAAPSSFTLIPLDVYLSQSNCNQDPAIAQNCTIELDMPYKPLLGVTLSSDRPRSHSSGESALRQHGIRCTSSAAFENEPSALRNAIGHAPARVIHQRMPRARGSAGEHYELGDPYCRLCFNVFSPCSKGINPIWQQFCHESQPRC